MDLTSTSTNSWPQPEQYGDMAAIGEQDFGNLGHLDFDTFDFLDFDPSVDGKVSENIDLNLLAAHQHGLQQPQQSTGDESALFDLNMHVDFDTQHDQGYSVSQGPHAMQHRGIIPLTPNSVEMHGDAARYLQQMDAQSREMLEQHYHLRKDDAANFTPLGTPAVTPHEAQFNIVPEFTAPGAYFSPISSPAIEGQHQNSNGHQTSASSPVDLDVDMLGVGTVQQPGRIRKATRRGAAPRTTRKVGQSPIAKAMQRRKNSGISVPSKEVSDLLKAHSQSHQSPTSPRAVRSLRGHPTSSSESISPEPLSEAIMGPPPKPSSAKASPAMLANGSPSMQPNGQRPSPATPASLMRLPQPRDPDVPSIIHEQQNGGFPVLDDLALPEAAASVLGQSSLASIDKALVDEEKTPRVSARKTPNFGPLSIPTGTARSTPSASAVTSPTNGITSPASTRKIELKIKSSKKRGSISGSALVSPALRPKLSPSVRPLVPEGASLSDDAHTLFLATRSNYQNLIEGTNLPGVSYPSDLPTQLTSKRTSHKIAEQGRRQRINVALAEMQKLLPGTSPSISAKIGSGYVNDDDEDDDEDGKRGGKGGGNSKAATVEAAIRYIKLLQMEASRYKQEKEDSEKETKELRKRLDTTNKSTGTEADAGTNDD